MAKALTATNKTPGIKVFVHEVTMQSINSRRMIGDCIFSVNEKLPIFKFELFENI